MGFNHQQPLEKTTKTMGTLLVLHPSLSLDLWNAIFSVAMLVVRDGRGTILLRPSRCDRQGGSQAAGAVVLHARAGRVFSCKGCLEDTLFFIHRIQVVVHLHH